MKDPLVYLVKILFKDIGLRIKGEELEFRLSSHPTYPSLHAVTGVLDHLSVKNYALEVQKNTEIQNLLPSSFMVLIKNNQQNSFALINKNVDNFQLSNNETQHTNVSENDFLIDWTGIIDEENKTEALDISVLIARKSTSKRKRQLWAKFLITQYQKRIETVFCDINKLFPRRHAVISEGFVLKIIMFILAYMFTIIEYKQLKLISI